MVIKFLWFSWHNGPSMVTTETQDRLYFSMKLPRTTHPWCNWDWDQWVLIFRVSAWFLDHWIGIQWCACLASIISWHFTMIFLAYIYIYIYVRWLSLFWFAESQVQYSVQNVLDSRRTWYFHSYHKTTSIKIMKKFCQICKYQQMKFYLF